MYSTQGIEAVATVTELRSRTSALIDQAKGLKTGIMIQKNNEPEAVLIGYELYLELFAAHNKKKLSPAAVTSLAGGPPGSASSLTDKALQLLDRGGRSPRGRAIGTARGASSGSCIP